MLLNSERRQTAITGHQSQWSSNDEIGHVKPRTICSIAYSEKSNLRRGTRAKGVACFYCDAGLLRTRGRGDYRS